MSQEHDWYRGMHKFEVDNAPFLLYLKRDDKIWTIEIVI